MTKKKNKETNRNICHMPIEKQKYGNTTYILVEKSILEFDVLNAPENEARELLAWLQLELKLNKKERKS